jgi:hypothetical protein
MVAGTTAGATTAVAITAEVTMVAAVIMVVGIMAAATMAAVITMEVAVITAIIRMDATSGTAFGTTMELDPAGVGLIMMTNTFGFAASQIVSKPCQYSAGLLYCSGTPPPRHGSSRARFVLPNDVGEAYWTA